jgi:hypothetical protein
MPDCVHRRILKRDKYAGCLLVAIEIEMRVDAGDAIVELPPEVGVVVELPLRPDIQLAAE